MLLAQKIDTLPTGIERSELNPTERKVKLLVGQSCPTLSDPMGCSPPGSSMGLSRQEHWTGLPFPSPEDLPDPGIKLGSLAWQADSLPSESPAKPTGQRTFDEGARNTQWGKVVSSAKFWDTGETCRTNQIGCLCCA